MNEYEYWIPLFGPNYSNNSAQHWYQPHLYLAQCHHLSHGSYTLHQDQDKEENDDIDNAFLEAGEQALKHDDAKAEFDKEMQDLNQMVESFKICAKEQWGDPTFKRAFKSFKNNF